jgi:hypothetical protein
MSRHIPTKLLTPSRRTPSSQAVSSSLPVDDGLLCCQSLGWAPSTYATRSTVTSYPRRSRALMARLRSRSSCWGRWSA